MGVEERIPVRLDYEIWPGTLGPLSETPPRRAGSIRRTTSVHSTWPHGFDGPYVASCSGRDLVTGRPGTSSTDLAGTDLAGADRVVGAAAFTLTSEPGTKIVAAVDDPALGALVGADLDRGFRKAAAGFGAPGSLLAMLLDDAPGASLVSGSTRIRAEIEATGSLPAASAVLNLPVVCVGRREGGMARQRAAGRPLVGQGPPCSRLERDDDPLAWHDEPPLPRLAMRRRRRTDVWVDGDTVRAESHFRDSRMEPDGVETSVHEYVVEVVAAGADFEIMRIDVHARVLPGPDCPGAVASAQLVVGTPLAALRATVRERLRGPHSCTHLDDQLRAMADVPALVAQLAATGSAGGA